MVLGMLLLAAALILGTVILRIYLRGLELDAIRERLRAGIEDDIPETISLWRDAADLLQLTRIQTLLSTSPLARRLQLYLRQLAIRHPLTQVMAVTLVTDAVVGGTIMAVSGHFVYSVAGMVMLPLLAWYVLRVLARYRVNKLEMQLPAMINQLVTSLRSGNPPMTALQLAAHNTPAPLGPSIAELVDALQLGIPPGRAWRDWHAVWHSRGTYLLSTAMRLKWEAGGEMTTLLLVILDQLEARRQRELRIKSLTAMARLSTYILVALPIVLFAYTYFVNPSIVEVLMQHPLGRRALLWTAVLLIVGFFWMRRMARLEGG